MIPALLLLPLQVGFVDPADLNGKPAQIELNWANEQIKVTRLPTNELPEPKRELDGFGDYTDFAEYALRAISSGPRSSLYRSAIVNPASLSVFPEPASCTNLPPAVAVDLDQAGSIFDVNDPPRPLDGLATLLAKLRRAGIAVLWITGAPPAVEGRIKIILAATGLDPNSEDKVISTPSASRKAGVRLAQSRQWCILAIAGDEMSDFEEGYIFLKDENGPTGSVLRMNIGNGWFLKYNPIG